MSAKQTDLQLVERVQGGDKSAFNLLVMKYQHKVANLISRYVASQGDIADVTQEVFIKAYRALPNFRGDSAFYTWLYRIASNTAKNYLIAQSRRPPANDIDVADAEIFDDSATLRESSTPERVLLAEEIKTVIYAVIDGLPDELRTAITLREMEGMSYDDISVVMDCPVGTVRSRIFRAREAIEVKLKPLLQN